MRRLALVLLLVVIGGRRAAAQQDSLLQIVHLDVGQGDATLIVTPSGKRVLIDAGPSSLVAQILRASGIDTLDLVVSSHSHADHIGGMASVFATVVVRAYLDNGLPHTTAVYRRTLFAVESEPGLQYLTATARTIRLDDLALRVLPPPGVGASQNNNSVGIILEYGDFRALYTGDSEARELAAWLRGGAIPSVTLVKAAHHGSWNGATLEWIRATAPRIVVVSVSARNQYGHPSSAVLKGWMTAGAKVYRTDLHGAVFVSASKSGRYTVNTYQELLSQRR